MSKPASSERKTAFLVITQGFAARFFLRTDIFRTLRAAGMRIVILAPNHDEESFRKEFEGEDVFIEPLRATTKTADRSRTWWLLYHLRTYTIGGKNRAFRDKYERFLKQVRAGQPWVANLVNAAIRVLWRSAPLRRLVLWFETRLYAVPLHADLFERYQPDLVVTGSPGYYVEDAVVLREAARRRIKTVSVIMGWDNPTSKGYRGATPSKILVWSERMADQVVDFQDYPRRRVEVVGVPHFDAYVRPDAVPGRAAFFAGLGLDPAKQLVVFATSTPGAYDHNVLVAETLARAIEDGTLPNTQLVVRLHPIYFSPRYEVPMKRYRSVEERWDFVTLDIPEILSERLRVHMAASDMERIAGLFRHADVLVNVFSTTTVEAFLCDTPVVMVEPTAHESTPGAIDDGVREELAITRMWQEFTHLKPLTEDGACLIGGSMEEIVRHVRTYLGDPGLHREQRSLVARRECGPSDGYAGHRIGSRLVEIAGLQAPPFEAISSPAAAAARENLASTPA